MEKAVIGTHFNKLKDALSAAKRKSKNCPHRACKQIHFGIVKYDKGYLVVSNSQLEE